HLYPADLNFDRGDFRSDACAAGLAPEFGDRAQRACRRRSLLRTPLWRAQRLRGPAIRALAGRPDWRGLVPGEPAQRAEDRARVRYPQPGNAVVRPWRAEL